MRDFTKVGKSCGLAAVLLAALGLVRCTPDFEGEYADPDKVEIVDDRWNETDARKTAEFMVKQVLSQQWLADFKKASGGKKPIVIVDEVENRTDEHIDTKQLTEFIRDELINTRRIRFLNAAKRQKILDEVKYQGSGAVDRSKAVKYGRQLGAQYMFGGALSANVHSQGGLKTKTYQTAMNLTNLQSAEMEWSGKYRIKKRFKKSGSGW